MDERSSVRPVQDTRRPAYGWGRILVGVFAVFGAIVLVPSLTTLLRSPDEEPAVWSLNLLGGRPVPPAGRLRGPQRAPDAQYRLDVPGGAGHHGGAHRRPYPAGSLARRPQRLGVGPLGPVPVVPACDPPGGCRCRGMWMSDPRRIVANAERITELSDTLTESITEKAPGGPGEPDSQDSSQWSGPVRRDAAP